MGISLDQYRARIGLFNLFLSPSLVACSFKYILQWLISALKLCIYLASIYALVRLKLLISGDVEPNPGPNDQILRHERRLSFCHANMRSIQRCPDKLDHIRAGFCGTYDIITLSETWLYPWDKYDEYGRPKYNLKGYSEPYRKDRPVHRGGGVLAWVSNDISCKRREDIEIDGIELMWLEVRCANYKLLLGVGYRTDEQLGLWGKLQESYNKALDTGINYVIITGYYNADPSTPNDNSY